MDDRGTEGSGEVLQREDCQHCENGIAPREILTRGRAYFVCAHCKRDVSLAALLIWEAIHGDER